MKEKRNHRETYCMQRTKGNAISKIIDKVNELRVKMVKIPHIH